MQIWFILLLLFFSLLTINVAQENKTIDSLELSLTNSDPDERLDILLQLSKLNWSISPQKGITYADSAFNLSEKLNEFRLQAKASIYGGVNYYYIGSYDKAIEYFHNALNIADKNQYKEIRAFAFNNIGMVYSQLDDLKNAKSNYQLAADIMMELNNEIEYAKIIDNIAKIYLQQNNYDDALKSYESIIDIIKKEQNEKFLLWVLCDVGQIYYETGNSFKAKDYYLQALKLSEKINDNVGKSKVLNCLGELSLQNKEYNNSVLYFNKALKLAEESGTNEYIKRAYNNLSRYYSETQNYKKSLEYFKLYKAVSDTILNVNREHVIRDIQTKYEIEKAEKENDILSKDNKIQQLELKKQSAINFYLILVILLVAVFVFLILRQLRQKREANIILSEKNILISNQKKELEVQAEQLAESNATKDRLFSIIAHDLKNPFNSLLGYTKLLKSDYDSFSEEERKDILTDIDKSASNTFDLLNNMLTWATAQRNAIVLKKEKLNLLETINTSIKSYLLLAEQKGIKVIKEIPDDLTLNFDQQTMSTVFINLINNSIKFTPKDGSIRIYTKQDNSYTYIHFEDTGIGMEADTINRLFLVSNSKIRKGTNNEKGTGLGLLICKDFVEKNGGQIHVDSEVGKGSVFKITLPNG